MSDNLKELIELGKPYLKQYLLDSGITFMKKGSTEFFKCINPEHEDRNPSCSIMDDGKVFHCFSCGVSNNIYGAVHFLENKPLYGAGFIKDNLSYVLSRYDIEHEPLDVPEEVLTRYKYEILYETASKLLTEVDRNTGKLIHSDPKPARDRSWEEPICRTLGIGCVKDFEKFIQHIEKLTALPKNSILSMGVNNRLFGPELLTFTVRDEQNIVRGFASRFINWKEDSNVPKYVNTSLEENPYYRKDHLLFGMNNIRKLKDMRLDIYEGYGSTVTANQAGYKNCCSIGGTALTEHHIEVIRNLGFKYINLVLDADETGMSKMDRYIDRFSGNSGLEVTIMYLPITEEDKKVPGQNDPDFFIKNYGIDAYRAIKPIDMFEHMLEKSQKFDSSDLAAIGFCKKMVPLIINQADMIKRGKMVNALATHTCVDKEDIKAEIMRLERSDMKNLKEDLNRKMRNVTNPDQMQDILTSALTNLEENVNTKKDRYLISVTESLDTLEDIFQEINTVKEGIHGWITGYQALDGLLDGIPKPGTTGGRAIGFAGPPQHGKSAAMLNIALNVALNNKDACILYWAIDDHRKAITYRLISMLSEVPMKKVLNTIKRTEEENKAISDAQDIIRTLTSEKKLVFKDDRFGRSKLKAETWIKDAQEATGNQILFCVDSLHNIQGTEGQEARMKIVSNSSWLKSLIASVPCTVLATIEMVKNKQKGIKPTLQEISESGKIEFDFDTLCVVWNEAQGNYTDVGCVNARWGSPGNWKPVIELDFQKNKAGSGEKGSVYAKYDTETTKILTCSKYFNQVAADVITKEMHGAAGIYTISSSKTEDEIRLEEDREDAIASSLIKD